MAVSIVIQLSGFEDQLIRTQRFILLFESAPFIFIGLQPQALQFDSSAPVQTLFRRTEIGQRLFRRFQTPPNSIGTVCFLRQTVHRNNDPVQPRPDEVFRHERSHRLTVGANDGVESRLVRLANHLRQVLMQKRFALEIELDGVTKGCYLRQHALPYFTRHQPWRCVFTPSYFFLPDRTLRTPKLADRCGFDRDEGGFMRNTHQAEKAQCVTYVTTQSVAYTQKYMLSVSQSYSHDAHGGHLQNPSGRMYELYPAL